MIKILFWSSLFLVAYAYVLYPLLLFLLNRFELGKGLWAIRHCEGTNPAASSLRASRRRAKQSIIKRLLHPFGVRNDASLEADNRILEKEETAGVGPVPKVSIIIAAYNEEKIIRQKIENCLNLDYPKELMQVIIASDGSNDATNQIVLEYSVGGIELFDYKERRGKVNVLNDSVLRANGEIIVFSDANTMFEPDAVKKLVRHFGDPRVGCVCGALEFKCADSSRTGELEGVYWRFETQLKKIEGGRGSLLGANGGIYALRKELYEPCPPNTIVEDFVIPMKVLQKGYRVFFDAQAKAVEEAATHIIQEKARRVRIGAGDFQALFMLLPMLNPLRGFSALAFFSHKVLRWFAPFLLIIIFITNIFLLGENIYLYLFALQLCFYLSALIGQALSRAGRYIKLFNLSYYFVSMNLALFLGFFRYIFGTQHVAWERTER